MSGHEGRLRPEKKLYVTLMGALELTRSTLAKQILECRQKEREGRPSAERHIFLTVMGATEIKVPTLAEEFLDMREMMRNHVLTMEEWDRWLPQLTRSDSRVGSFTLMGGFSEWSLPPESQEIDSLALQRHLGNIPDHAGELLQMGIGQRNAERWAVLRRAVHAAG
jgi:hypothetical protein